MRLPYGRREFIIAGGAACATLGHNPRKALAGACTIFVAFGVYGMARGAEEMIAKVEWWLAGLVAAAGLYLPVFLYHLFKLPTRASAAAFRLRLARLIGRGESLLRDLEAVRPGATGPAHETAGSLQAWRREVLAAVGDEYAEHFEDVGEFAPGRLGEQARTLLLRLQDVRDELR